MNKSIFILAIMLFLYGCDNRKRTLSFYTWDDYIDPEVITEFEREYDCKVIVNVFDSNEAMYAKLLFSQKGYDVVLPSSYQIVMMKNSGMIDKLDMTLLPNVTNNFDKKYDKLLLSEIRGWSIPYAFSMTGIAYRKDKFKNKINSWSDIENLKFSDKICLFSDIREVFGASLKRLGYSGNSTNDMELKSALNIAKKWKNVSMKFDNEAWKTGIACGEFNLVMAYNSDIFQILSDFGDESNIEFCIPTEGIVACFDEFVIIKESENKDLAYNFIDFMYRPDIAKRNIEYILAVMPNREAVNLLSDEMKSNPLIVPTKEILEKCEILDYLEMQNHQKYVEMWDELKATEVK